MREVFVSQQSHSWTYVGGPGVSVQFVERSPCIRLGKLVHEFGCSEVHCFMCVHCRVRSSECSAYRREKSCLSSEEG